MIIGLAGVTSTGKTTMATAIKERYGNAVEILWKIPRTTVFDAIRAHVESSPSFYETFVGHGMEYARSSATKIPHDLTQATDYQRALFDLFRLRVQMSMEARASKLGITTIVDGCSIVKAAYMLYLSAPAVVQYFSDNLLTELVDQTIKFTNETFSSIFYLPFQRVPFQKADHRVFKNKFIRMSQDAILHRLLSTELARESVKIESFYTLDMENVFDVLAKMGVK